MDIQVDIVHAFVSGGEGGNPAGIVLDADHLDAADKQAIARMVGLSETAFVTRSRVADFKLEFFTPSRQIAHCGHATVATFCHLRHLGRVPADRTSKETIDGVRDILMRGACAYMEQRAPHYALPEERAPGVTTQGILESLGLQATDGADHHSPLFCSTGNGFLLVPVRSAEVLQRLQPRFDAIHTISDALDVIGYYAFARTAGPCAATARMFAPRYGIPEEAGTGMAAGPLACYLHDHAGMRETRLVIEQGTLMDPPSPSRLLVELHLQDGAVQHLFAGGQSRHRDSMLVTLPERPVRVT